MKSFCATAIFVLAAAALATAPVSARTPLVIRTKATSPACKHSLQSSGSDGSTAMAELPATTLFFNYRHVPGAKPLIDNLRALGALRCASDLDSSGFLIDLRTVFETMGGTVSYSRDKKTIFVAKPGTAIRLTVGKKTVTINGETRPLDQPPLIYYGAIYVPIRVISEGLGGYVVWDRIDRNVVVRYLPQEKMQPTPPPPPTISSPAPLPAVVATPFPTPEPTPSPAPFVPSKYEHFIVGDYIYASKTYDVFAPGNTSNGTFAARAATEFPLGNEPILLGGDYRNFRYPHNAAAFPSSNTLAFTPCPQNGYPGCVTTPGHNASVYVPALDLSDQTISGNIGIGVASKTYFAASYLTALNNYPSSYPKTPTLEGFGFGVDRLPDLRNATSLYFSVYDYPSLSGDYAYPLQLPAPSGTSGGKIQENFFKYQVGFTANFGQSGIFLDTGFLGDSARGRNLSPGSSEHAGAYAGFGIKF